MSPQDERQRARLNSSRTTLVKQRLKQELCRHLLSRSFVPTIGDQLGFLTLGERAGSFDSLVEVHEDLVRFGCGGQLLVHRFVQRGGSLVGTTFFVGSLVMLMGPVAGADPGCRPNPPDDAAVEE